MIVSGPFLSLNIPKPGLAGYPVAVSRDPHLLRQFKHTLIAEWERIAEEAPTDTEAAIYRLELGKLRATLDLLIPDDPAADVEGEVGQ